MAIENLRRVIFSPLAALAVCVAALCYEQSRGTSFQIADPSALYSVLGTIAQVSSAMMGFFLAAMAILASIAGHPLIKAMERQGYYRDLLRTLMVACALEFICFVAALVPLIFGVSTLSSWRPALVGSLAGAFVCTAQVGWKMWLVLSNVAKPSIRRENVELEGDVD